MLRIAGALATAAALAMAPAPVRADAPASSITSWVSSAQGVPPNATYLVSYDNAPTTLKVGGTSSSGSVDIVCYFGAGQMAKFATSIPVSGGRFQTTALSLRPIAGHACRLRAIPAGTESSGDSATFAGPRVAISETGIAGVSGGANNLKPYDFLVNPATFTGSAAWHAAGSCGPYAAPVDSSFGIGNFAINCAGSLLGDDLGAFGGRSEVQVDGRNAYDAASAQALFGAAGGNPASQDLTGFPALSVSVDWDPTTGLASSNAEEAWALCDGPNQEKQAYPTCPRFDDAGVKLGRRVSAGDGGRVVTMADTWSSTDGRPHTLDLLYDDFVGPSGGTATRGYEFPGQGGFAARLEGDAVPGPGQAPGSVLVRTNLAASDGNPAEAFGAITFSKAPEEFRFAPAPPPPPGSPPPSDELEEHQVLQVPAGGSASLTYVYSVGYSAGDVKALALAAQDRFQPPALSITSPANGATVSTPSVALAGTASSGSGIRSLSVGGQPVAVGPGGVWNATIPLTPGTSTISAVATDGAGATASAQVTVVYRPPPPPSPPAASRPATNSCKVPRAKGMKLRAAERMLRAAHCKVGKVRWVRSRKIHRGRVMSTSPGAGRKLPAGSKVQISVSRGPKAHATSSKRRPPHPARH